MKFKLVPEPPDDLDAVADAQRAVPLIPESEDDCCARLMRRCGFESRDVARTWLTFLRALDLAEETSAGFERQQTDPTREHLRQAFVENVYGAAELHDVLREADGPVSLDTAFEQFRERVPNWERHKQPHRWEETWRERVERILDWLVLLDFGESVDGEYRLATAD